MLQLSILKMYVIVSLFTRFLFTQSLCDVHVLIIVVHGFEAIMGNICMSTVLCNTSHSVKYIVPYFPKTTIAYSPLEAPTFNVLSSFFSSLSKFVNP